ncbi:hypothetical protein GCM10020367_52020 [Streptomyces sannanensis]|uniref:Arc-like DNA binding domain-containing protein n=1 Tax=Streptomyces sannanensis TaxID=285536 RepID=A0ABP6SHQ7_9ACTN
MILFSLRIPADLHERVVAQATEDRRSLNSEILHLLEVALTTPRADAGPPGVSCPATRETGYLPGLKARASSGNPGDSPPG